MKAFYSSAFVIAIVLLLVKQCFAQNQYPGWNIYTSMKDVRSIDADGSTVWAASTGGLFTFDLSNIQNVKQYRTIDGLLSNELTALLVDANGNVWTGSNDGAICTYSPSLGRFRVFNDIMISTEPSKKINSLFKYSNYIYFSTEYSIIKFDINRFEITDQPYIYLGSLPIRTPVYESIVINDTIWAATKNGIAFANINNYLPIAANWNNFTTSNSSLKSNKVNTVAFFNGKIYFGTDSGMVYYEGNALHAYEPLYNGNPVRERILQLKASSDNMYLTTYLYSDNIYKISASNLSQASLFSSGLQPNYIEITPSGSVLAGTARKGIILFRNNVTDTILPNSPYSNIQYYSAVDYYGRVWGISGSLGPDWSLYSGIYRYDGSTWKNYLYDKHPILGNGCCGYLSIYASGNSAAVWAGGLGNGLVRIVEDSIYKFDETNSFLESYGGPGFVIAMAITEDFNGNLWLANNFTPQPLVNFTKQAKYSLPIGNSSCSFINYMVIDQYGTKWMVFDNVEGCQRGVMFYNEAVPSGGKIQPAELGSDISGVYNISLDKNGEIWIATNNGIVIIPNPYDVIRNPNTLPYYYKMRIIENGISTPLTESVGYVGVDALNYKWIGTKSNGLLYVSPDGSNLIARYNTSNSPLTSTTINHISFDNKNGIAYFGLPNALVSHKTVAVEPLTDCDVIKVSPSPFLIPSSDPVKIDGLVAESSVKILTLSGVLINEFVSPGGRVALWDGKDLNGNLVPSGIYIIAGFNKDGSKVCTGKIAVIRK